jgi:NADH-quinone oxidoreductase subunit J
MGSPILFIILAVIAVVAALGMLLSKNAIYSALFLILNFGTVAVFYLLLNASFLAFVQVAVYAGAIMVLFLFVIMLLGAEQSEQQVLRQRGWQFYLAVILGVGLVATFVGVWLGSPTTAVPEPVAIEITPQQLAITMFENYVFPFEVTSILLLVAVIGLFIMSKKLVKKG